MREEYFTGVTVLIPTFNRREKLERAIASALQETRIPIRVHVFDNASTDDTESFARSLAASDPRVRYTRRVTNLGALENYERAFAEIEGSYLVPLADDDLIARDFLNDSFHILERCPEACAAAFVAEIRDFEGCVSGSYPDGREPRRTGLLSAREHMIAWMRHGHYHWSSVLWRSESLRRLPPPYLAVGMPSDIDFQARLFCRSPVYVANRIGCIYMMHQDQIGWSFDLTSLPNWSSLFRRLDVAVQETGLFSLEEYAPLRRSMVERYCGAWRKPADRRMERETALECALAAGFALGDWSFAFDLVSLAESAPTQACSEEPLTPGEINLLPRWGTDVEPTAPVAFEPQALTLLRWLKANHAESGRINEELEALRASNAALSERLKVLLLAMGAEAALRENALLEVYTMHRSLSWRITAPARWGMRVLRRALRR